MVRTAKLTYYRGVLLGTGLGFLLALIIVRLVEGAAWYLVPTLVAVICIVYLIISTGRRVVPGQGRQSE